MNRLQNSIVRFLKYVIELENLMILLNIGSLSFLRVSFIADRPGRQVTGIEFCDGEGVETVYNRKPLNRDDIS